MFIIFVIMGIAERKEREREELKEKIIKGSTELFLEHGIEGTSIRMIADKIEYSPATIYLHFKDKNELFYVIMERAFGLFFEYFSRVLPIKDPMERLHKLGDVYLKFAEENPFYYDLMFVIRAPMDHTKDDWDSGTRSHAVLTNTVQECIDEGYFKGHNPEGLSLTIWSTVHGLATLRLRGRLGMYDEKSVQEMMSSALSSLNAMLERA